MAEELQDNGSINSDGGSYIPIGKLNQGGANRGVDTLTVNLNVYHTVFGDNPEQAQLVFSKPLKTSAEPYHRKVMLKKRMEGLPLDWLEDTGSDYVIFQHKLPVFTVNPSAEDMERIRASYIRVLYDGTELSCLHPGDGFLLQVTSPELLTFVPMVAEGVEYNPKIEFVVYPK